MASALHERGETFAKSPEFFPGLEDDFDAHGPLVIHGWRQVEEQSDVASVVPRSLYSQLVLETAPRPNAFPAPEVIGQLTNKAGESVPTPEM